jgi:predicted small lipoprotein YifL
MANTWAPWITEYKTVRCNAAKANMWCSYGETCLYYHNDETPRKPRKVITEGKNRDVDCWHEKRGIGNCTTGKNCLFLHEEDFEDSRAKKSVPPQRQPPLNVHKPPVTENYPRGAPDPKPQQAPNFVQVAAPRAATLQVSVVQFSQQQASKNPHWDGEVDETEDQKSVPARQQVPANKTTQATESNRTIEAKATPPPSQNKEITLQARIQAQQREIQAQQREIQAQQREIQAQQQEMEALRAQVLLFVSFGNKLGNEVEFLQRLLNYSEQQLAATCGRKAALYVPPADIEECRRELLKPIPLYPYQRQEDVQSNHSNDSRGTPATPSSQVQGQDAT